MPLGMGWRRGLAGRPAVYRGGCGVGESAGRDDVCLRQGLGRGFSPCRVGLFVMTRGLGFGGLLPLSCGAETPGLFCAWPILRLSSSRRTVVCDTVPWGRCSETVCALRHDGVPCRKHPWLRYSVLRRQRRLLRTGHFRSRKRRRSQIYTETAILRQQESNLLYNYH